MIAQNRVLVALVLWYYYYYLLYTSIYENPTNIGIVRGTTSLATIVVVSAGVDI